MTVAITGSARRRRRLHADRDHRRAGADGSGAVGARQHHRAMAAELESRRRPHPAQRGDRHRAATDRGRSRRGGICPRQSRATPPLFDGSELSVTFVRTAMGPNVGPGSTWCGSARRPIGANSSRCARARDFAPLPAGLIAVGATAFRRSRGAAARAVPAVLCLCRPGSDLEKHLARRRQIAGHDQADGSRCGERTRAVGLDDHAGSCPGAERLHAAGRQLRSTRPIAARYTACARCASGRTRLRGREDAMSGVAPTAVLAARLRDRRRALDSDGAVGAGDDLFGLSVGFRACARASTIRRCRPRRWYRPASNSRPIS